ncbi:hypothetical protein DYB28_009659 [Aphanomyces astaci]|uniref:WRKY19-like zinc finger domain-containing protein n=1 Tax=Aphanomyces astaci TaxID=112090 RepID=A0A397AXH4_APHAT|nr:hypothetical protein DYB36_002902 [Aphanomyces astaci]RHY40743.1 hypothetical protein DYB38_003452 [Aphanomyces astaci]RHY50806.1 hypothetical protein DYB34_000246 [Aphanomyces astaci]RHZ08685.1 hypothetical protein DYB31_000157 [Aphanomyces astaci]RLO05461.1 hypothetical protein DYB28_009659 [Aphanomyces astaci]
MLVLRPLHSHFGESLSNYHMCSRDHCAKYAKILGLCLAHCGVVPTPPSPVTRLPSTFTTAETTPKTRKKVSSRPCSFNGCSKAAKRKGVCMDHGGRHFCKMDDCHKCAHKGGFCISHGGGRRCAIDGCGKSAQAGGTCYSHGGGKNGSRIYCKWDDCHKCAHKGGFCIAHGGGRRCDVEGCTRSAQAGGSCYSHGGGKRCQVDGCNHAGRLQGLCIRHKKVSDVDALSVSPVQAERIA